jgi:hypothetical protein
MPSKKDTLMTQAIFALAQGCGGAQMEDAACEWFYERYYPWIDKKKTNPKAAGKSPQDVWDKEGPAFLDHFKEIGRRAASGGGTIQAETLSKSATSLESELECPWCPISA